MEGWDNAPHHKDIETYPYHKHTKEGVKPLHDPSLEKFFKEVYKRMRGECEI